MYEYVFSLPLQIRLTLTTSTLISEFISCTFSSEATPLAFLPDFQSRQRSCRPYFPLAFNWHVLNLRVCSYHSLASNLVKLEIISLVFTYTIFWDMNFTVDQDIGPTQSVLERLEFRIVENVLPMWKFWSLDFNCVPMSWLTSTWHQEIVNWKKIHEHIWKHTHRTEFFDISS